MEQNNPYMSRLQADAAGRLRLALLAAVDKSPDQEAGLQGLARQYGAPVDAVRQAPLQFERQAQLDAVDYHGLVQHSPVTSRFLSNPQHAAIAHDDIDNLSAMEQTLRLAKNSGRALLSGVFGFGEGVAGQMQAGAELLSRYVTGPLAGPLLPVDIAAPLATAAGQLRRSQRDWREYLSPMAEGNVEAGYYAGLQSLTQNALTWPLALAGGNPQLALQTMALNAGGQSYGEGRDQGLDAPHALLYGAGDAAIEYGTERLPLHSLFADVQAASPFFKLLTRQLAQEIPGEQAATLLQDANAWSMLHPDKTLADFLAERPDAAVQTLVATAVASAGQSGILHAAQQFSAGRQADYATAEQQGGLLQRLRDLARSSKLLRRDPEAMRAFVDAVLQGQPQRQVYADARLLQQSGLDKWLSGILPDVAQQLPAALQSGGEISIPISDYVSRVAAEHLAEPLQDVLRLEGQAYSKTEAHQYMLQHAESVRDEVQRLLDYQQVQHWLRASADGVKTQLRQAIDQVSPFTGHVNDNYAALLAHFYTVQAERFGVTPQALFDSYPLQIKAELLPRYSSFAQPQPAADPQALLKQHGWSLLPDEERQALLAHLHSADQPLIRQLWDEASNAQPSAAPHVQAGLVLAKLAGLTADSLPAATAQQLQQAFSAAGLTAGPVTAAELHELLASLAQGVQRHAGQPYWQWNSPSRGSFDPFTRTITLNKGADLSTFLHEAAHFFLELQFELTARLLGLPSTVTAEASTVQADAVPPAPPETLAQQELLQDSQVLLRWFGVADLEAWQDLRFEEKRGHHEQFARAFEAYLFEGKAPALALQGMFERFRAWLLRIYSTLKRLMVNLQDEVRGVFDRMLASAAEINATEQARGMRPLFDSAESAAAAGMSAAEFAAYLDLSRQAKQTASAALQTKTLQDMQWLSGAHNKTLRRLQQLHSGLQQQLRAGIRQEVMNRQVYMAWEVLTDKNSDVKLNHQELLARGFSLANVIQLRQLGMVADNAAWPMDAVAEWYEYSSGADMVHALLDAPRPLQVINDATTWQMYQNYAELTSSEERQRAAWRAVHNVLRGELLAVEADTLAKTAAEMRIVGETLADYARSVVERTRLRQLNPGQYVRAEAQAAMQAEQAWRNGELREAALAKRRQVINFYAAQAAFQAEDAQLAGLRYLQQFYNSANEMPREALYLVWDLLERFQLGEAGNDMGITHNYLEDWLQSQREWGLLPDWPQELVEHKPTNYLNLSLTEFKALLELVRMIEHLSIWLSNGQLLATARKTSLEQALKKLQQGIKKHGLPDPYRDKTPAEELEPPELADMPALTGLPEAGAKLAYWALTMDGGKLDGPVWTYFLRPALQAGQEQTTSVAAAQLTLSGWLDTVLPAQDSQTDEQYFAAISRSLSSEMRLVVALHTGNDTSLQYLLTGEAWSQAQLQTVLDSLSEAEWRVVQQIWDFFSELRPQIAARHQRVYGVNPLWSPLRPRLVTPRPNGAEIGPALELRGGYYPLQVNQLYMSSGAVLDMTEVTRLTYFQPYQSAAKPRWPLQYSLSGLYSGVDAIFHDLAWFESWLDMRRIMQDEPLRDLIKSRYKEYGLSDFDEYLQQISVGSQSLARTVAVTLGRSGQYGFALQMAVTATQEAMRNVGFIRAVNTLEPAWLAVGFSAALSNPRQLMADVNTNSDAFSVHLLDHQMKLGKIQLQHYEQNPAAGSPEMQAAELLMLHARIFSEMVVWWAVYQRSLQTKGQEASAIFEAEAELDRLLPFERSPAVSDELQAAVSAYYGYVKTGFAMGMGRQLTELERADLAADYLYRHSLTLAFGGLLQKTMRLDVNNVSWHTLTKQALEQGTSAMLPVLAVQKQFGRVSLMHDNLHKVLDGINVQNLKTAGYEDQLPPGAIHTAKFLLDTGFDIHFWAQAAKFVAWDYDMGEEEEW